MSGNSDAFLNLSWCLSTLHPRAVITGMLLGFEVVGYNIMELSSLLELGLFWALWTCLNMCCHDETSLQK